MEVEFTICKPSMPRIGIVTIWILVSQIYDTLPLFVVSILCVFKYNTYIIHNIMLKYMLKLGIERLYASKCVFLWVYNQSEIELITAQVDKSVVTVTL